MNGLKPLALREFYWSLHDRGEDTATLASKCGVSGGAVRRLITGHRRRRGALWTSLREKLTPRERSLLSEVEQSSTWNTRRSDQNVKSKAA